MSFALAGRLSAVTGTVERPAPVPLWAAVPALILSVLAAALPVEFAAGLPVALFVALAGFIRPFLALLALTLAIPVSSLLALDLGGLNLSVAEPLAALLALGWLAAGIARAEVRLEGGPLVAPLLAVFVVMLTSALEAEELPLAASEVLKWVELLVVFFFAASPTTPISAAVFR